MQDLLILGALVRALPGRRRRRVCEFAGAEPRTPELPVLTSTNGASSRSPRSDSLRQQSLTPVDREPTFPTRAAPSGARIRLVPRRAGPPVPRWPQRRNPECTDELEVEWQPLTRSAGMCTGQTEQSNRLPRRTASSSRDVEAGPSVYLPSCVRSSWATRLPDRRARLRVVLLVHRPARQRTRRAALVPGRLGGRQHRAPRRPRRHRRTSSSTHSR